MIAKSANRFSLSASANVNIKGHMTVTLIIIVCFTHFSVVWKNIQINDLFIYWPSDPFVLITGAKV